MYNMSASHTAVQELEYSEVYYACTPKYHKLVKMKDLCFSETIALKIAVNLRENCPKRESVCLTDWIQIAYLLSCTFN